MQIEVFLKQLKKIGEANDIPNISFSTASYIQGKIHEKKIKNMLEIGTANGFSAINFMIALEKNNGSLTTIEFSKEAFEEAKKNFEKSGYNLQVTPLLGNALEIIPTLQEKYDCIFIDGMKKHTKTFFTLAKEKLHPNGIVIIDDVIKFRYKMKDFYDYLEEKDIAYEIIQTDEDDGIMLIENLYTILNRE